MRRPAPLPMPCLTCWHYPSVYLLHLRHSHRWEVVCLRCGFKSTARTLRQAALGWVGAMRDVDDMLNSIANP